MDRYKNFVRIEELKSLLRQGKNEEALEIADGMDPKKIKDNCDCMVLAEVFLNNGMLGKARECYTIVYGRKKSRRVAMELVNICIRMKKADEAQSYFDDYKLMAPNDYFNHIFKYKIDKLKGKPLKEQAADLEALRKQEFSDTWGYELAKIYHKMGEVDKCRKICEEVIVWFGDGEAVEKAKTLKAYCMGEITLKELSSGKTERGDRKEDILEKNAEAENLAENNELNEQMAFEGGNFEGEVMPLEENYEEEMTLEGEDFEDAVTLGEASFEEETAFEGENFGEKPAFEGENSGEEMAFEGENSGEEMAFEGENFGEGPALEGENFKEGITPEENGIEEMMVSEGGNEEDIKLYTEYAQGHIEDLDQESTYKQPDFDSVNVDETESQKTEQTYFDEDDDVKIYTAAEKGGEYKTSNIAQTEVENKEGSVVTRGISRTVQDNDLFTDEIARAVEEALKEESEERRGKEDFQDDSDATKEWRKPEVSKAISEGEKAAKKSASLNTDNESKAADDDIKEGGQDIAEENTSDLGTPDSDINAENTDADVSSIGSKLMEAVDRELGFVESGADSKSENTKRAKKGWLEKLKEKHQEKERRKIEQNEQEEREELRKIRELELEKQRFIESEKRKDRIKYLEHQKQISRLSNEKAKAEQEAEQKEALRRSEELKDKDKISNSERAEEPVSVAEEVKSSEASNDNDDFLKDFLVDTKDIQQEAGKREIKNNIYSPKVLPCIEIPGNSVVTEYLANVGKNLEYYFGFFACQKNISNQILRCLERLLDSEEENMNYCIIGERGTGKKALVHGFAKFMFECGKLASSQIVWTGSEKINATDLRGKADKLKGRCLAVDRAGGLDDAGLESVYDVVKKLGRKSMIVIADYRRNMVELFNRKENFEDYFGPRISIPDFSLEDLYDYVDYKACTAGFVFDAEAYDLIQRRIKGIYRATEEGALARTEKYIVKTMDNAEQRNGEEYIRQTLVHEKHVRSNVIILKDVPDSL